MIVGVLMQFAIDVKSCDKSFETIVSKKSLETMAEAKD